MKKSLKRSIASISIISLGLACSSSDDSGDSSSTDSNDFTPSTLSLNLPSSLTSTSDSTSLSLQSSSSRATPTTTTSEGFQEVSEKIQRIQFQMAELSLNNSMLDKVYANQCAGSLDTGSCTASNVCVTLSNEMVNSVKQTIGDKHFQDSDGELSYINDLPGSEYCFSSVTINALTDNAEGYHFHAEITEDSTNKIQQYWNTDRTKVKIIEQFQDNFDGKKSDLALSSSEIFKGTSTFIYDDTNKIFKAKNSFSFTSNNVSDIEDENFTIQSLSDELDASAVLIKGHIRSEFNGNKWSMKIEGKVDDNGGFIRTGSGWSSYSISSMTLSAACAQGSEYWLYPKDSSTSNIKKERIYHDHIGSFYCSSATTTPETSEVYIDRQLPSDPSQMVLMTVSHPEIPTSSETEFFPTLTASNLKVTAITASPTTTHHCYEEEFTTNGQLKAWRAADGRCDSENLSWIQGNGEFGTDYSYDDTVDGANFAETKIQITGVTEADLQTASGLNHFLPRLFITVAESDLSSFTPQTPEFDALLLGTAWPKAPDQAASSSDVSNYIVDYWGSSDQLATAELWVETVDSSTGQVGYVKISGATVSSQ